MAGSMNEEQEKVIGLCKQFVLSMVHVEQGISAMQQKMPKEERRDCLKTVLHWVETAPEIPADSYTRELAREILGQLSATAVYDDYAGSTDSYIQ
jgi:hypothetical protein